MDTAQHAIRLWSLRRYLVLGTALLVGSLGLLSGTLVVLQNRSAANEFATTGMQLAGARVVARVRQLLDAAEMTAASGAALVAEQTLSATDFVPVMTRMVTAFEQRPELTYLGLTLARTGEYALLERRPDGQVLLRLYLGTPGPTREVQDYQWRRGAFVAAGSYRGDSYDPRTRPFYLDGVQFGRGTWTNVYRFVRRATTDAPLGMTYALPVSGATGGVEAMWDASLDLRSLTDFLMQLRRDTHVSVALATRLAGAWMPLVDSTLATRATSADAGVPPLTNAETLTALLDSTTRAAPEAEGRAPRLHQRGGAVHTVRTDITDGRLPWVAIISTPADEFSGSLRRLGAQWIAWTALLLLLAFFASLRFARRLAAPLEELQETANLIAHGSPLPPENTDLRMREVVILRSVLRRMAAAIVTRERELRQDRQRLQSHIDNTPLGVLETDVDLTVRHWNPAAQALLQWAAPTTERHATAALPGTPAERAEIRDHLQRLLGTRTPLRFAQSITAATGERLETEWYATPTTDEQGQPTGITVLLLDVTQRETTERAFQEADERFERLFRVSPAPAGISRVHDGQLIDVNDAALQMFGYTRAQVLQLRSTALALWVDDQRRRAVFEALATQRGTRDELMEVRTASGAQRTVRFSVEPVQFGDEPCALWVCIDVGEEIAQRREVAEKGRLLARLVELVPDPVLLLDAGGHVTDWNSAAQRTLGLRATDVIGREVTELLDAARAERIPPAEERDRLVLLRAPDISSSLPEWSARRARLVRDVADEARDLAEANQVLRDRLATRDRFLAVLGHELRTPLTSIVGNAELLRTDLVDGGTTAADRLASIRRAGQDLLALLTDLLDVARHEAGRLRFDVATADAHRVLADVRSTLAPVAAAQGVTLTTAHARGGVEGEATTLPLRTDARRLAQILLNLGANAIKHAHGRTVHLEVTAADGGAQFVVADDGVGIAAPMLARLFEPFETHERPDGVREDHVEELAPGAGLGLYFSRRLAEALGGRMTISSVAGQGTRCVVWIPSCEADVLPTDLTLSLH